MSLRITFKKVQSGDTSQRIPFRQLSIDYNMDVHKDVHYQVKHRLYTPWTLQENSQSEGVYRCSHIIKVRNGSRKENTVCIVPYVAKTTKADVKMTGM